MPSATVSHSSISVHRGAIFREGEFWRIAYDGESFGLRHSKGLTYLAQLLRSPGTDFHALDLSGAVFGTGVDTDEIAARTRSSLPRADDELLSAGIHVGGLGDAGEMLDEQAKAQYRRRLDELREELDEAKQLGNIDRAERAETEIDHLRAELSRAVGLGGRNRRAASASERARQSVTHAIKSAIEKIGENQKQLGAVLARCVKTGSSCGYYPDPAIPVAWEFAAAGDARSESIPATSVSEPHGTSIGGLDALRPPAAVALGGRSRTTMVGREAEMSQLLSAAARALRGHGAIVLLGGGPGAGKTRLSLEFIVQASQRGFACFSGRCYERDEPHPLMPFVEIIEEALAQSPSAEQFRTLLGGSAAELAQIAPGLRRVFPDLPTPPELPTAQVRRFLFQGLFDFIARISEAKPLLLVLEDLHWADESTLAMVNFLARRIGYGPVLVLATYRDEELDATLPLHRTLEELLRLGIHPIKLRGLAVGGVAQMLAGLSQRQPPEHLVSLIFEETQGNPFFVEEVFSHLVEEGRIFDAAGNFQQGTDNDDLTVPENVRLVLGRRLTRLTDNAREVLSAAAVIGRSFSFMLLEAVLDRTDPDTLFGGLEEAQRAGFITSSSGDSGAPPVFSHELVRQTLLAGMSPARQQRLHFKIAQGLEKVYGARIEEHAAEVAHHLLKSGAFAEAEMAARYLSLAGQSSLHAGALEDARRTLTAALTYQREPVGRAKTLAALASAERGLGNWTGVIAHLQDSIALYATLGDRRAIGKVVFDMVEGFVWTGRFEEAAKLTERGLTHLLSDESVYRARLLPVVALIHAARGELAPALKAFDEALASSGVTPFVARVLAFRSFCRLFFLQLDQALEDSQKSASLSNDRDSPWTHAVALSLAMRSLYHLGKPDQALRIGLEVEPLARAAGHLAALSSCLSVRAWAEFGREPDLAILERRIREIVNFDREKQLSWFLAQSLTQMSHVRFFLADWDSARSIADEARAIEPDGLFTNLGIATLVRIAAYSGDRRQVLEIADRTRAQLPTAGQPNSIGSWSLMMGTVEALVMVGERARAAALYPCVPDLLRSGAVCMEFTCRFPATIAGIAAGAGGEWELAEQHFGVALKQAIDLPHRLEEAEVRRFHAMMLLQRNRAGDRERAQETLTPALDCYERIAMPRHIELTRALLAKAGH